MTRNMLLVYVTIRDRRQARRLGARLVEERLAACVNVLGPITSIYRWKGRVQEDGEVALLAKTTAARWPALLRRVRELHTYETPCVVAVPLAAGHPDFLKWLAAEVRPIPGGVRRSGRSAAGNKSAASRR